MTSVGYSIVQFCFQLPGRIFNKISEYVRPYVQPIGDCIQAVAQKFYDTKLGKATVEKMQFAKEKVLDVGYKALEAAEWMIDKRTMTVNYVGQKATDAANWIGETRFSQAIIGGGKQFGSWIASTSIWKSAAEMTMYFYTKMVNFCTAVSESYHYYNQCRTASRRIALANHGIIDDHMILKTYDEISQKETKKNIENFNNEEKIRKHIASWRQPLVQSLMLIITNKLNNLSNDKYHVYFVQACLQNSSTFKHFQTEISHLLNHYAWLTQISYFKVIQLADQKKTPLKNLAFPLAQPIPKDYRFFIDNSFDQILEEFQKLADDKGFKSTIESHETVQYKNWKDILIFESIKLIEKSVDFIFIEQTTSTILAYLSSLRDANLPPSEAQLNFTQDDKALKEALAEYNTINQSKRKAQFLVNELYSTIHKIIIPGHVNKNILKIAIKYGYPLPLSVAETIAIAMDNYLTKSGIYSAGIYLEISNDQNQVVVQFSTKDGKAKIIMRHFRELIFLCQSDYQTYVGISDQTTEEIDNAFFYEVFIGKMKYLRKEFPKQAESLREGIINEL